MFCTSSKLVKCMIANVSIYIEFYTVSEQKRRKGPKEPYFTVSLHDTELLENTYLRFLIKVCGDPKPEVKLWVASCRQHHLNLSLKPICLVRINGLNLVYIPWDEKPYQIGYHKAKYCLWNHLKTHFIERQSYFHFSTLLSSTEEQFPNREWLLFEA